MIILLFFHSPAELQFYTSLASIIVQIPATLILVDVWDINFIVNNRQLVILFILNGVFFHFQSITAYVLMDYISPVTHRYVYCNISQLNITYEHVLSTYKLQALVSQ